jgi:hypothetical protein
MNRLVEKLLLFKLYKNNFFENHFYNNPNIFFLYPLIFICKSNLYFCFMVLFVFSCQFKPVERNVTMDFLLLTDLIKNMPVTPSATATNQNPTTNPTTTETTTSDTASTPEASIPGTDKIFANIGWQNSSFVLNKDVSYQIKAYGTWSITSNKKAIPPEGLEDNPSLWGDFRYDLNFNHGQLLCRLNTVPETIFSVGTIKPTLTGTVQCRVNDTDLSNNTGFLEMKADSL